MGGKPPARGGLTSAKKTAQGGGVYSSDQKDKIYDLERENAGLKTKENFLESEIIMMKTKVRKIENLMKENMKRDGVNVPMPAEVQRQIENEIAKLNEENAEMKRKNKKLNAIAKELSIQQVTKKAPTNKYSHVKGKLSATKMKQSDQEFIKLVEELKIQLVQGERTTVKLESERDQLQQRIPGQDFSGLQLELDSKQKELGEINRRIAELKSDLVRDESMFSDSKQAIGQKQKEINDLSGECDRLAQQAFEANRRAAQAKELTDDLEAIRQERDQIENSISQITAYPFRGNKSGEPSAVQRIEQLNSELSEKNRIHMKIADEEAKRAEDVAQLQSKVNRLKTEVEIATTQHEEARAKFVAGEGAGGGDLAGMMRVGGDMLDRFPESAKGAMGGLGGQREVLPGQGEGAYLAAHLDPASRRRGQNDDEEAAIAREIQRSKNEITEIAAELEKAQSLLKLQTDIEKENSEYYEREKERLRLLAQSNSLKAQEMAKRVDGQAKLIKEMKQKLGLEQAMVGAPSPPGKAAYREAEQDGQSDFSDGEEAMEGPDQNCLQLLIMDAQFSQQEIQALFQAQNGRATSMHDFNTAVTAEFYNHEPAASPPTPGFTPQYRCQVNFANKMDTTYVNHISSGKIRFDIFAYSSSTPNGLPLGTCEIFLAELLYSDTFHTEGMRARAGPKPIERELRIHPTPIAAAALGMRDQSADLGFLRVKMRLQKPIREALRYADAMGQVKDATAASLNEDVSVPRPRLVIIKVKKASDLVVRYGDIANIAPFFYYQFFTCPAFTSETGTGKDPSFEEPQTYDILFDTGFKNYLQTQHLEIDFIDDQDAQIGIEGGDMDKIGTCKVPLADLAKQIDINGSFDIIDPQGKKSGEVTIDIRVVDPAAGSSEQQAKTAKDVKSAQSKTYSDEWATDVIRKIAFKLGRLSIGIPLMFGIFSRGSKSCSREDFTHCCLRRLDLQAELSRNEIKMLLDNHERFKYKGDNIDQNDFMAVFGHHIAEARDTVQDQEALDRTIPLQDKQTIGYSRREPGSAIQTSSVTAIPGQTSQYGNSPQRQQQPYSRSNTDTRAGNSLDAAGRGVVDVLAMCISNSSIDEISRALEQASLGDKIKVSELRRILERTGGASDFDAQKVTTHLGATGGIHMNQMMKYLDLGLDEARGKSQSVQKFNKMIRQGQGLPAIFMSKDLNQDGELNIDGFRAAVLLASEPSDYKLKLNELADIFKLVSRNGVFLYADYLSSIDPNARFAFQKLNLSADASARLQESSITIDQNRTIDNQTKYGSPDPGLGRQQVTLSETTQQKSISQTQAKSSLNTATQRSAINPRRPLSESPALAAAKQKIEHLMITDDITLGILFNVIDTNSDKSLSKQEFKQKLRGMRLNLSEEELESLFRDLDVDGNNVVSYNEFIKQFTAINTAQIIKRIRRILSGSAISPEYIYNRQAMDKPQISKAQFKKILKELIENLADFEIDSIFVELVGPNAGHLPKERFIEWFGYDQAAAQGSHQSSIEDIIKPLAYVIKASKKSPAMAFEEFDTNKDSILSAEELRKALALKVKFDIGPGEVKVLREFFQAKYGRDGIKKAQFAALLEKQTPQDYDAAAAKEALKVIKQALGPSKRITDIVMQDKYRGPIPGLVSIGAFKQAINSVRCLTPQQVLALARSLEKKNDGMIKIADVTAAENR